MGATTLFHPVSLHVIRGAVEYCGWKFGKIVQTGLDNAEQVARYRVEIERIPPESQNQPEMIMLNDLDNCFSTDIKCHWLRKTQKGVYMVDLVVAYPITDHHVDVTEIVRKQQANER